jgi:hypothetical protein
VLKKKKKKILLSKSIKNVPAGPLVTAAMSGWAVKIFIFEFDLKVLCLFHSDGHLEYSYCGVI